MQGELDEKCLVCWLFSGVQECLLWADEIFELSLLYRKADCWNWTNHQNRWKFCDGNRSRGLFYGFIRIAVLKETKRKFCMKTVWPHRAHFKTFIVRCVIWWLQTQKSRTDTLWTICKWCQDQAGLHLRHSEKFIRF